MVTGQLQGSGQLNVGDTLMCDGMRWQISGIEQFRAVLTAALPGSNIGVLLSNGPPGSVLRGRMVQFEASAQAPLQPDAWTPLIPRKKRRWRD